MLKTVYKIQKVRKEGGGVKVYQLQPKEGKKIAFKPGQFVKVFFPNSEEFRMYSIASCPGSEILELGIKILPKGKLTQIIDKMGEGDELTVEGPFGHVTYEEQNKCVFFSAGCGISSIISMLRYIAERQIDGDFVLFFSCRTKKDIVYKQELDELSKKHKGIKIIYTLTRETPENWEGELGRLNKEMIEKYIKDPKERMWYACGKLGFVKIIKEYALGKGVPPQQIKMEGWG